MGTTDQVDWHVPGEIRILMETVPSQPLQFTFQQAGHAHAGAHNEHVSLGCFWPLEQRVLNTNPV